MSPSDDATAVAASAAPPDAAATDAPVCPLCEYDLRAQVEPRCPECGYHFDWAEMRDPARRLHPYVFEHHPERNVWSFVRTLLGGLRPKRFWQMLYPTQPARPARLVLYWLLAVALCAAPFILHVVRAWPMIEFELRRGRAQWVTLFPNFTQMQQEDLLAQFGTVEAAAAWFYPSPTVRGVLGYLVRHRPTTRAIILFALLWLLWPLATFVTLMIFQTSMRRARVKPVHVMRAVLYTGDAALWATLLMLLAAAWDVREHGWVNSGGWQESFLSQSALLIGVLMMLLMMWRLSSAYRHYLRFDHPLSTAAASQVIVWLALLTIMVVLVQTF